jgi:hypothetical protein
MINTKYHFYLDMDGVIADFDSRFKEYTGYYPKEYQEKFSKKEFFKEINKGGHEFWSEMPWTPFGHKIWNKLKDLNVSILTSPGEFHQAKEGKLEWVKKHLGDVKVDFKLSGQKHTILDDRSIPDISETEERMYHVLIDDHYSNLIPWDEAGGKSIKVTYNNTSAVIKDISSTQK